MVVQLAFVDGNLDDHLKNPSDAFPLDGFGRPTFRPSAAWYMAQVDFNNAHEYKTLDKKIVPDGNDLLMNFRFEGLFSEVMEMQDFPCDVQELTMSLCFNTRTTGMMPLEIVNAPSLQTGIIEEGFVDGMMWDLYRGLDSRPGAVGRTEDRIRLHLLRHRRLPLLAPLLARSALGHLRLALPAAALLLEA